ncbi:uncharacterized protein LOC134830501 [Culicoides brevitarsis]|uniref:uncharacterized protein LOC134830501 n=1 Tax=Culicoides brevitarsis TaxID=469753 RepID=UPI00307B88E5
MKIFSSVIFLAAMAMFIHEASSQGVPATSNDWPSVAFVWVYGPECATSSNPYCTNTCAGIILSPGFVLTTARCVTNGTSTAVDPSIVFVYFGDTTPENPSSSKASQIIVHPGYAPGVCCGQFANNLALIRLATNATFGAQVNSAALGDETPSNNVTLFGLGFGSTGTLQYITSQVACSWNCTKQKQCELENNYGSTICVQKEGVTVCDDMYEGGPFFLEDKKTVVALILGPGVSGCVEDGINYGLLLKDFYTWINSYLNPDNTTTTTTTTAATTTTTTTTAGSTTTTTTTSTTTTAAS